MSKARVIDLRSDTVTKPSPEMQRAMAEAEVGDDVYGEDPTVNKLEETVSTMFQKEAALFFPTGTMSNIAAVMSWCGQRGAEVILGDRSHLFYNEVGNLAQLAGVTARTVRNEDDGTMSLAAVEEAVRGQNVHFPVTELIAIESTHSLCGGRVLSLEYIDALCVLAGRHRLPVHLDGARLWNAAERLGCGMERVCRDVDSVSVSFSKGLGCPVGSMLVGPRVVIDRARRMRKALGGGMRQAGVLAAACLVALDDFQGGLLRRDHENSQLLAQRLNEIDGCWVDMATVDTNIVFLNVPSGVDTAALAARLVEVHHIVVMAARNGARDASSVRLMMHRDVHCSDIDNIVSAVTQSLQYLQQAAAAESASGDA